MWPICGQSREGRVVAGRRHSKITNCACCACQVPPVLHGRPSLQTIATAGRQRRAAALHARAHSKGAAPRPLTSRSTAPLPWRVSSHDIFEEVAQYKSVRGARIRHELCPALLLRTCTKVQSPPATFKLPPQLRRRRQYYPSSRLLIQCVSAMGIPRASGAGNFLRCMPSLQKFPFPLGTLHFLAQCPWHAARKAHSWCA
jgi:hypothetical protein